MPRQSRAASQYRGMITGRITDFDGKHITVTAEIGNTYAMEKQSVTEAEIRLLDGRTLSPEQRRKVYALFRDIAMHTGYEADHIKGIMKYHFIETTGSPEFSLSDVDMSTARAFIDFLVEFCLSWGIPCMDTLIDKAEDIGRYLYLCLFYRRCCICGKDADVHHVDAVGMGADRRKISHVGRKAIALCRWHHIQAHSKPDFYKDHHVYGIPLDEFLVRHLQLGGITHAKQSYPYGTSDARPGA